jgi:hypothetical protein
VKDVKEFRDAGSRAERARIFQTTGIPRSELLELPYWDLQIDLVGDMKDEESISVATPEEMVAARKVWVKDDKTKNQLRRVKVAALLALCIENNVVLPRASPGRRLLKSQIIDALLNVSTIPFVS